MSRHHVKIDDSSMQLQATFLGRRSAAILFAAAFGSAAFAGSPAMQGIGNFHKVDDHVYRGAQPSSEGFHALAKLGIKIVVDLREPGERSQSEEKLVTGEGMQYVPVPMQGMHAPPDESVIRVLNLLEDTTTGPVFVHCMRGADRTGNVIACYRIEHDHWQNERALAEARSLGMSRFEKAIQHYVLKYQPRPLNIAPALAGAATAPAAASVQQ